MTKISIVLVSAVCVATVGCSKSPDHANNVVVPSSGGGIAVEMGKPPTNLPSYAPAYPGAQWTVNFEGDSDPTSGGGSAHFITTDKPDDVFAFYEKAALANGLTTKTKVLTGTPDMTEEMLGQPGTTRALTVTARPNRDGRGIKVGLGYGPK